MQDFKGFLFKNVPISKSYYKKNIREIGVKLEH